MLNEDTPATELNMEECEAIPTIPVANWPKHWGTTRLADERRFSIESGTWTGERAPLVECSVIRNTNFTADGALDLSDVASILIEQRQLPRKRLARGDIIIERSGGGPKQPVGRVAFFDIAEGTYSFSNFTSRVRVLAEDEVDARFLHLFLHYLHLSGQTERLQRRTTGIRNLAFADYKSSDIPLPPLPEQHAIVHAICAVQDTIQARRRERELERERKATLMQHLFTRGTRGEPIKQTEIGEMPESWRVALLNEVADINLGRTPARENAEYWRHGVVSWVSIADLNGGVIKTTKERISAVAHRDVFRGNLVPTGTILLSFKLSIGKVGILGISAVHNEAIASLQLRSDEMERDFLFYQLPWLDYSPYLDNYVKGKTLNKDKLKALRLALPSPQEQRDIAELLAACDAKVAALDGELVILKELFGALLEELMTGRLSALPLVETEAVAATGVPA